MAPSNPGSFLRFDFRILAILLLLSVIPLVLGSWWLFNSYEDAYVDVVGASMSEAADMVLNQINSHLQERIIVVAGLTEVPVLRRAVERGNLDLQRNLEQIRKAIPEMESRWASLSRQAPEVRTIVENEASDFLRRYAVTEKSFREIMVTDFFGRLVAATGKTSDYYQADEDWWKDCYGDGRTGFVHIGDIGFDESAQIYSMELAQPFLDPEGGVIGVIKVVMDAQDIHALIGSARTAPSTTTALLRNDGRIISAPGHGISDQAPYPGSEEILATLERGRRYFVTHSSPQTLYGLTSRNIQETYPNLNWILVTASPIDSILGKISQLRQYFISFVVGIFLLNLIVTLILSRVETAPVLEQDPHLERL